MRSVGKPALIASRVRRTCLPPTRPRMWASTDLHLPDDKSDARNRFSTLNYAG
jgi:hypothetical protein